MTKPLPFTEARVRRALAAARKEGIATGAVSVHPDGTITVHWGVAPPTVPSDNREQSRWLDVEV
jgi:hypothetical protein